MIGKDTFRPQIVILAREECSECGEEEEIELTGTPESKYHEIIQEYFESLGWSMMAPEDRDYYGPVCKKCQKDLLYELMAKTKKK